MIVTEDQAVLLLCPHQRKSHLAAGVAATDNCLCVASGCSQWTWYDAAKASEAAPPPPQPQPRRGYCGLALPGPGEP